jgi:hypothetical protein
VWTQLRKEARWTYFPDLFSKIEEEIEKYLALDPPHNGTKSQISSQSENRKILYDNDS